MSLSGWAVNVGSVGNDAVQAAAEMPIRMAMTRAACIALCIGLAACNQQSLPAWIDPPTAPTQPLNFVARIDVETQALFGGNRMTATVTLNQPASANTVIELSTNNPVASVPATVQMTTGTTTASFQIETSIPDEDSRVILYANLPQRTTQIAFNVWRPMNNEVWYEMIPEGLAGHFTPVNAKLLATCQVNRVSVTAEGPNWQFIFATVNNAPMRPRSYESLGISSLSIRAANADVLRCMQGGISGLIGRFTVEAMDLPPRGPVRQFIATFQQFCQNDFSRSIRGGVQLNLPSPSVVVPPSQQICNQ